MNHVIRHTEYLLSRYDCVIIPGLGAMLAHYTCAQVDNANSRIMPPSRELSFNSAVCDNDGLLAQSVARALGVSIQRALHIISTEVARMKQDMQEYGMIQIGAMGRLILDRSTGNITFNPDNEKFTSTSTLWLMPVNAFTLEESVHENVLDIPNNRNRNRIFFEIGRVAAVVALIIGAWYIISSPFTFDEAMKASLIPELFNGETKTAVIADAPQTSSEVIAPQDIQQDIESAEIAAETEPTPNYYVIVGASVTADDAQAFIDMHPGFDLQYRRFGNQYRVYISTHATADEASRACADVHASFPYAWYCANE